MRDHELRRDQEILVPKPESPGTSADFTTIDTHVDASLEHKGTLHGVLIHEDVLRRWSDFGALLAQLQVIRQRHRQIEKVAVVADRGFATIIPFIAGHFIHAQVRHFDHAQGKDAARAWLMDTGRMPMRTAA